MLSQRGCWLECTTGTQAALIGEGELQLSWARDSLVFVPLQGVRIGETSASAVALNVNQAERVNVERGCSIPDPCDSNPCPDNSYCSDDWDSYSCSCDPGEGWARHARRSTGA